MEDFNLKIVIKADQLELIERQIEDLSESKDGFSGIGNENPAVILRNALKVLRGELSQLNKRIEVTSTILLEKRVESRHVRGLDRRRGRNKSSGHDSPL